MKPLIWLGDSLDTVRAFPKSARVALGNALNALKQGRRPVDSKSLSTVAPGVAEIRVHDEDSNQYRVIYVAKFAGAVHVLHAFQKKTRRAPQMDLAIARDRLKALRQELRNEKGRRQ